MVERFMLRRGMFVDAPYWGGGRLCVWGVEGNALDMRGVPFIVSAERGSSHVGIVFGGVVDLASVVVYEATV